MGAAFGRFVGEVARYIVTDVWQGPAIIAGGYAVVGAAGLSAGVTRTLSTAVIVFELTGQLQYFMPVLVRATRCERTLTNRAHTHTHIHTTDCRSPWHRSRKLLLPIGIRCTARAEAFALYASVWRLEVRFGTRSCKLLATDD